VIYDGVGLDFLHGIGSGISIKQGVCIGGAFGCDGIRGDCNMQSGLSDMTCVISHTFTATSSRPLLSKTIDLDEMINSHVKQ